MESALNGLSQMAILIIVAAVGFLAAKLDYLDEYTNQKLTKLLLNITLPCMVVASVHGLSAADAGETVGITFAMAIAQGFLLLLVGWLLVVVLRVPKRERVVYQFVTICNNTGFLGLPVVGAILGSESVIYASIYVMVLAVFVYGVGFMMLAKDDPLRAEYGEDAKVSIPWRSIVNPSMIASVLALVLFFTGWQVPDLVQDSLSLLGGDHRAHRHAGGGRDRGALAHEERGERDAALPLHDHPPAALASALLLGLHRAGCFATSGCRVHAHIRDARRIDVSDVRCAVQRQRAAGREGHHHHHRGVVRVHPAVGRVHGIGGLANDTSLRSIFPAKRATDEGVSGKMKA